MIIKNDKQAREVCEIIVILTNRFINYIINEEIVEDKFIKSRQFKIDSLHNYLNKQKRISADLINSIRDVIDINYQLINITALRKEACFTQEKNISKFN